MKTRMSATKWGELVAAWESSGLSAEAFAGEHGVAESTLRWWKTELARRARHEVRRRPPRRQRMATSAVTLARVVRPGERPAQTRQAGAVAVIVGGARIIVEQGFDGQLLREVVRALEAAR
jgi:hypothetical protein